MLFHLSVFRLSDDYPLIRRLITVLSVIKQYSFGSFHKQAETVSHTIRIAGACWNDVLL